MADNFGENNNDNDESKKIVNSFKNELEKLKQKLNKEFNNFSKIEKEKTGSLNFHYRNNYKNEPNIDENNYNELKQDIKTATDNIDNIINITEIKDDKTSTKSKTNSNNSIFTKIPSLDELKNKYGINVNNKPSSIKEITIETNMNKFNKNKDKNLNKINHNFITDKNENKNELNKENNFIQNTEVINKNNINNLEENVILDENKINRNLNINTQEENKIDLDNLDILNSNIKNDEKPNIDENINNYKINKIINENKINPNNKNENNNIDNIDSNKKKSDNKYDYINLLKLKNDAEEEIKNIFNRRDILDLSDNSENKENSDNSNEEEIHINNKINKKIINKDDEEELEIINKYINDDNSTNKNNINLSILKNINNINNINNNNISNFSNISNINNNQDIQKQLMIDIPSPDRGKTEKNDLKNIKNLKASTKEKNIICNTNINTNENKNNNLNLENDNKSRLITYESPIKTGMNNNNSIVDTSMLNSKIDQQIKLINEKSENNRIEEEKNLLKLKELENSLQLDKRLTHTNREIRKNAIKELCEMCTNFNSDEDDKAKAFECFSPWVKYCLEETNSYVIPESLNFFILFNSLFPNFLSNSMKDFFDNIERYINFGISSINENCFKIFFLFFQNKKLFSQSMNEIIKLLNSSYIKMVKFLNSLLISMIENNIISENYVKLLFEKLINIYVKTGKKLIEKKKIYSKLLTYIYNNIEDDYSTCIKTNIKLSSYKELDSLFNKIKKNKKKYKYRLYPKSESFNIDNESQVVNNNNFAEKNKGNKTPEKKFKDNNKEKDNLNNLILNNNSPDVNDILSVLPNEFFEYHFLTQFQTKIKLLEDTNNILNKIKNIRDKEKNLVDVYKTINYSIEDSNILIHLEGIKLLENICRLVKNFINIQKLKLLLETCFDKLKDKKSLVKNELFTLFNMIIENHCFEIDKFIFFILQFCTNQKKENAQVKMGLLEYIKILFLQQNNILFYEVKKIKEKDYYNFIKKIVIVIQKESLSSIKDLCSDLLIIFKKRVEDIDAFYDLIAELPNYRKKIINEEESGGVEEGEYKKNLKRIKSSYSFSKTKYTGGFRSNNNKGDIRLTRSKSNARINNFEKNRSRSGINASFSTGKNIKVKNNINKNNINNIDSKSKNSTRTNFRNNQKYKTGGLAKFKPKKVPSSSNINTPTSSKINKNKNLKQKTNSSKSKNRSSNYSSENNNEIEKEDNNLENNNEINDNDYYNELNNNNVQNNINQEVNNKADNIENDNDLNQQKENLLENLHNLDINSLEKYSKIIINDFLIFINKVCDEQNQNEDLSYHFNIIFTISEKLLYRLIVLLNENQEKKENFSKLKKLLEEFIGYISKIIILTPCIDQVKGSNKFDTELLEAFMDKIKEFCLNKEKFYMNLLLSLYKFCQKDEQFPKSLNPKPSAIYFLKYLRDGYLETKSENLLNVLKGFISETKLLNLEEKKKLLIDNTINDIGNNNEQSFDQKMDDEEQNEEKEEEENNIINNNIVINKKNNLNNEDKIEGEEENKKINQSNKLYKNKNDVESEDDEQKEQINKIKKDILNSNDNKTNQLNQINNINNSIALKLKQFQERLNRIPNQEKETTITGSEDKKTKEEQSLNYEKSNNKENNIQEDDDNNKMNKSKLNDNDLQKIEDSIRLMSKRLDNTLNKMNEISHRNKKANNISTNNSIISQKGNINNLANNSINISKISDNNINNASVMTSESFLKNNFINNFNNNNNINQNNNKEIIEQLINVVKGESNNNNIYQTCKIYFQNLSSFEEKFEFLKTLRNNFENPIFLRQIPINTCTNLFDFILTILSFQILNQTNNNEQIITYLQGIAEYLLEFRSLNDMFKIMLFLLKKYFPKNLNNKIEDLSLVMIKVISYLLKELLKKMNKENIIGKEIISEINDLFTVTPPSTLTTATPNALFYQNIFTLLKTITDLIARQNKNELINIIQYLQENKIVCEDYIQYLIRLQKVK